MNIKLLAAGAVGIAALSAAALLILPDQTASTDAVAAAAVTGDAIVAVSLPELSGNPRIGQAIFNVKCAQCHGENAAGRQGKGPPLIHQFYRPGHHADEAFFRAARNGVTSHHWQFGNMPPVTGITDAEIAAVVGYIREVQKVNGIY